MTLKEIIETQSPTFVDVRNPGELAEGHIPGALNIPVHDIPARMQEIAEKKGPYILFCRSGNRSSMAIQILKAAGFPGELYNGGGYADLARLLN
ncbi:MAG TPA: rhodanese-like domain-containing protein [Chitinophagaceae bacterium]|nr:rhodanese-like domain-containing protein [Chitinophagaceae bacterium]